MTRWMTALTIVCVAAAASASQEATGSPAAAQATKPQPPADKPVAKGHDAADTDFMRDAAMANLAEIEHGRLAETNATSADVKQFAQRMVADHSKVLDELKTLASKHQATLPTTLDQKHQAMQDKFAKMKGADFDRAYASHMVTAHQQAIALFERESKTGKDAEAKAWAEKTLSGIREHHKLATELSAKAGK